MIKERDPFRSDPVRRIPSPGHQLGPAPRDPALAVDVERMRAAGFDVIGRSAYERMLAEGFDPVEIRRWA